MTVTCDLLCYEFIPFLSFKQYFVVFTVWYGLCRHVEHKHKHTCMHVRAHNATFEAPKEELIGLTLQPRGRAEPLFCLRKIKSQAVGLAVPSPLPKAVSAFISCSATPFLPSSLSLPSLSLPFPLPANHFLSSFASIFDSLICTSKPSSVLPAPALLPSLSVYYRINNASVQRK